MSRGVIYGDSAAVCRLISANYGMLAANLLKTAEGYPKQAYGGAGRCFDNG